MIIGLPIESWNNLPKIGDEILKRFTMSKSLQAQRLMEITRLTAK